MVRHAVLAVLLVGAGCTFNVRGVADGGGDDLGVPGDGFDPGDLGGSDGVPPPDLLPLVCAPAAVRCVANGLETCRGNGTGYDPTPCPYGCASLPSPRCNVFYPVAPVVPGDLDPTGLTANVSIPAGLTFDTNTGQIGFAPGPVARLPNGNAAAREVISGIAFHTVQIGAGPARLAVWSFNGLTLAAGSDANANIDRVIGGNAMALVSATTITLQAQLDLTCVTNVFVSGLLLPAPLTNLGGPGGGSGATVADMFGGGGGGGGTAQAGAAGGGGGGHGTLGAIGGKEGGNNGGIAGGSYGLDALNPLRAGSGGGAGRGGTGLEGSGGGGGGAIHLVAGTAITIGTGTLRGGVNAGGCGGRVGGSGNAGGGGGSGGAILVEAPTITLGAKATLAANGGAGAGGDNADVAQSGAVALFDSAAATGGAAGNNGGTGGNGAASGTSPQAGGNGSGGGGGGGGALGRIRLNSSTAAAATTAGFILSPRVADGLATQGVIDVR
ncbi:MAG TPA: hypothetical protein VMZ28_31255 [Kofleriaceae bacterium]|nr:hypothetical protein [Kofleriaceae bacterium]